MFRAISTNSQHVRRATNSSVRRELTGSFILFPSKVPTLKFKLKKTVYSLVAWYSKPCLEGLRLTCFNVFVFSRSFLSVFSKPSEWTVEFTSDRENIQPRLEDGVTIMKKLSQNQSLLRRHSNQAQNETVAFFLNERWIFLLSSQVTAF